MLYSRIRKVKELERGTSRSAGIDFFVPIFDEVFLSDLLAKNQTSKFRVIEDKILLEAHEKILIPSGIKVNIPTGYALVAKNKSGIGSKKGLDRLAELIDEDYIGEIHINLVNTTNNTVDISANEKIIQFVLIPINYEMPVSIDIDKLYVNKTSDRGEGGFGSTNIGVK